MFSPVTATHRNPSLEASMPRSALYTTAFRSTTSDTPQVSRFFKTLAAARRWAAWLNTQSYVADVLIYRGPAGGDLLEIRGR
jgi:hypothetical protein